MQTKGCLTMIEINWNPTRRELRSFSAILIVFCGLIASAIWYRTGQSQLPLVIFGFGLVTGVVGCIWPNAVRMVYLAWMVATFPIGWTVSHLVLAIIYFFVFTPIGWLLCRTGHDPLRRKWSVPNEENSYWELRTKERKPADYFRQF